MGDEEAERSGWQPGKFVVKHYRRGDLLDGEAFVLVPERDPAALVALRAYAGATPDPEMRQRLDAWADFIDGGTPRQTTIDDRLPTLVASYAAAVEAGSLDLTTALFRIAAAMTTTEVGEDELPTVR